MIKQQKLVGANTRIKWLSTAIVTAFIMTFTFTEAAAEEIVVKFSHVSTDNSPKGQMAVKLQKLVEERLAGKIKLEIYPNSLLYTDNEVLQAVLLDEVQLAAPSLSKFGSYTKKLQIFDLPFLFSDIESVEKFQQGPEGQALLNSMLDKGIIGLGYFHNGFKQLSANSRISIPIDAQGLKFRIQDSDVIAAQFASVGAISLKRPFAEVYPLLKTQTVDGQENSWSNMGTSRVYELQKFVSVTNHGLIDYMVVTSDKFWQRLPDDIRETFHQIILEAAQYGNEVAAAQSVSDRQMITDSPFTTIVTLRPEERAQWIEKMKPVWTQFENEIGSELIEAALAAGRQ